VRAGFDESFPYFGWTSSYYDNNQGDNKTPPAKGNLSLRLPPQRREPCPS